MTLFAFRGAKSHKWTFCDPINSFPIEMTLWSGGLSLSVLSMLPEIVQPHHVKWVREGSLK